MEKDEILLNQFDEILKNANGDLNTILNVAREVKAIGTPEISNQIYNSIINIIRKISYSK